MAIEPEGQDEQRLINVCGHVFTENIQQPPAGGVFLDHKPELAVPQGGTSEQNTSAGPEDVSHEFENSATTAGGSEQNYSYSTGSIELMHAAQTSYNVYLSNLSSPPT